MGYGPLRYLNAQQVKGITEALQSVKPEALVSKLDRKDAEAKRIYLAHTLDRPGDWEYLPSLFREFRNFYQDTAQCGNAMLLHIS
jgi:hypothetical protein